MRLRKKLAGSEEDLKLLLMEQERHKKSAHEKIKILEEFFK